MVISNFVFELRSLKMSLICFLTNFCFIALEKLVLLEKCMAGGINNNTLIY